EGQTANRASRYLPTEIAALCPLTMALLGRLLDLERSRAVAFLMLEPHARIEPHCDDTQHEVMRSVNLALNMPDGCEFLVETNRDGVHNRFTRAIPFRDGSAMLIN